MKIKLKLLTMKISQQTEKFPIVPKKKTQQTAMSRKIIR